ncbi:MAG: MFS transporter [Gammaproteobacteria bacterium]|nr:MFS transporter [Gammaproteobacteria bacterium]
MRPLHHYCLATGTWFAAHGVQGVMFAWLVTMVLHETPQMVGVAQMAMLVPVMLLMLFGGGVADALGGRRIAILAQSFAVVPSIGLLLVLAFDALDFRLMIIYAVAMGCATAFVTPARDGLLNLVAEGRIQRTVTLVSLIQFGVQMVGFTVAGLAGRIGPLAVIGFQTAVLIVGAVAYTRLPAPPVRSVVMPSLRELVGSVVEGSQTVLRSDSMRPVVVQNIAMGICFMGSYIVAMPLLVREVYQGDAADLSMVMIANALGLVTSILLLLLGGGLRRQGRALLLAHFLGCIFLGAAGLDFGFWAAIACIYLWGACGGVAMSMSRTIMQEAAPDGQRGRVMAFFSFSFMGAGPLGALIAGYLVGWVGPPIALFISSATLMVVIVAVALTSSLWNMTADAFLATSRSETPRADEPRQAAG